MSTNYFRGDGVFDAEAFGFPVNLIGAGTIGNVVALALRGFEFRTLILWDSDRVEPHNVLTQLSYFDADVDRYKIEALRDKYWPGYPSPTRVFLRREFVSETTKLEGIVISGVDSVASRERIWGAVKGNPFVPLYIDAGLSGDAMQIMAVNPNSWQDQRFYESWLHVSEEDTWEADCGQPKNFGPSLVVAGLVTHALTQFLRGNTPDRNTILDLNEKEHMLTEKGVQ